MTLSPGVVTCSASTEILTRSPSSTALDLALDLAMSGGWHLGTTKKGRKQLRLLLFSVWTRCTKFDMYIILHYVWSYVPSLSFSQWLYSQDSGTTRSSNSPSTFSDIVCRPRKGLAGSRSAWRIIAWIRNGHRGYEVPWCPLVVVSLSNRWVVIPVVTRLTVSGIPEDSGLPSLLHWRTLPVEEGRVKTKAHVLLHKVAMQGQLVLGWYLKQKMAGKWNDHDLPVISVWKWPMSTNPIMLQVPLQRQNLGPG